MAEDCIAVPSFCRSGHDLPRRRGDMLPARQMVGGSLKAGSSKIKDAGLVGGNTCVDVCRGGKKAVSSGVGTRAILNFESRRRSGGALTSASSFWRCRRNRRNPRIESAWSLRAFFSQQILQHRATCGTSVARLGDCAGPFSVGPQWMTRETDKIGPWDATSSRPTQHNALRDT